METLKPRAKANPHLLSNGLSLLLTNWSLWIRLQVNNQLLKQLWVICGPRAGLEPKDPAVKPSDLNCLCYTAGAVCLALLEMSGREKLTERQRILLSQAVSKGRSEALLRQVDTTHQLPSGRTEWMLTYSRPVEEVTSDVLSTLILSSHATQWGVL